MQKFKTESKKLLDLMINSIYTNREIFLRELISNSSDAIDKLYFRSLTDESLQVAKDNLQIVVTYNEDERTITVSDNGIGMTKDELNVNLGTIAHSDSQAFKADNADSQGEDVDIIGQFGVGFYSGFMVASKVCVVSRAHGSDEAWVWESDGIEGYTIKAAQRDEAGTDVVLHLKENTADDNYDQYLDDTRLEELIKRYSNYVRYPIMMEVTRSRMLPIPMDAGEDYVPEFENYKRIEVINSMIPIWKRNKSEVTEEEYFEFYRTDFHDAADPQRIISLHAEGALTYDALLFIPSHLPQDMYNRGFKKGLALYSSNVLIQDKCEELLPDHFNFVQGIVDSQDLTLNISRETLQHNSQLRAIGRRVEKKIKAELAKMRDNEREQYEVFFKNFGRVLKYGVYASQGEARDVLADLLMFYSAKHEKMVTLEEYYQEMDAEQNMMYYATGDSIDRMMKMPAVKTVLDKGYDVLLGTDDVDEFCLSFLRTYGAEDDARQLRNVTSENLGLETAEERKEARETAKDNEDLLNAIKEVLGEKVERVSVSTRLSDSPACITAAGPVSLGMEKIISAMPGPETITAKHVLELNPKHRVFASLQEAQAAGDTDKVSLYANILYNQARLVEGLEIEDPIAHAMAVYELMK